MAIVPTPAQLNQDFVTYKGDNVKPQFTVLNSAGTAIDISTVSEIAWYATRNPEVAAAVTKTKTGGAITFVNTGTDGKFQVALTPTDTNALDGNYVHYATITLGGLVNTVEVGAMTVGLKPLFTYDPGSISTTALYAVRDLIGDVRKNDILLYDGEIEASISAYSNSYLAAADCCRKISARFSRDIDTVQGELRTLYSSRQKSYRARAFELQELGMARGGAYAYAGGISQSDKDAQVVNQDRVAPQFNIGMMDNLLPIGPVGHETPGSPQSETGGVEAGELFGQP